VIVRTALAGEREAVGALRVSAYESGGFLDHATGYVDTLRVLGFGGHGTVLVAVDEGEGEKDGKLVGTVMFEPWHPGSEVARSREEAEVRALAVAPWAQGRGVARALMSAVIDMAPSRGARRLLLSTQPDMEAAQHLYRSLGFTRNPDLDWSPIPDFTLLSFCLPLADDRGGPVAENRGGRS
jgi:ribosomal protein S18 acetylase RimI-like enzyme